MNKTDIEFFKKELKGGKTVYFYAEYQGDGDFDKFSKIIARLEMTKEQVEVNCLENPEDADGKSYLDNLATEMMCIDKDALTVWWEITDNE